MRLLLIVISLFAGQLLFAQVRDSLPKAGPVEIDILVNYYEQDGNHSAVTGGTGTEELNDIATQIQVYVPIDEKSAFSTQIHHNRYTSASTDKIDTRISSASFMDNRAQVNVAYNRFYENWSYTLSTGASIESDYLSTHLGTDFLWSNRNGMQLMSVGATAYFDQWLMIFPTELRSSAQYDLGSRLRRTLVLRYGINQILHKRWRAGLDIELVGQWGLLSTPFHRVYFHDKAEPSVERLPSERYKIPVSAWVNWAAHEKLSLHLDSRLYYDSWGVAASTSEFSFSYSPVFGLSLRPHVRFHIQSQALYFDDFMQHSSNLNFYTSDWDLSALHSYEVGLGLNFAPLYGKKKGSKSRAAFKYFSASFSYYERSDGLWSFLFSSGLGFQL